MNSVGNILQFLRSVDQTFPTPLSDKTELTAFAQKLCERATLCIETDGDRVGALVAGYTDNLPDSKAYISIVATLPELRGRGVAKKLIRKFIDICAEKHISAVHLYATPSNSIAMKMYYDLGFQDYIVQNEPRPQDAHLIYYIEEKK